jgi:hypothetical protein
LCSVDRISLLPRLRNWPGALCLHLDKGFDLIADLTGKAVERLRSNTGADGGASATSHLRWTGCRCRPTV